MKNKILKMMVLGGATIAMFFIIRYKPFSYKAKRKNNNDQKHKKKLSSPQIDDYPFDCPHLFNSKWKKIGKVSAMFIYPVKSSEKPALPSSYSYNFFDYGMCEQYNGTYFYDGMFIVYNRTKGTFEDARTYEPLTDIVATIANQTNQTENAEVKLYKEYFPDNAISLNIHHDRTPSNHFTEETWSGDIGTFYDSNEQVNTSVKDMIAARTINQADEDIILTQMIPSNFHSTQQIRANWNRFIQGYVTMEEDDEEDGTGKLITLPRFVLMSLKTYEKLHTSGMHMAPSVIICNDINDDELNPFEEANWNLIRIGANVILKNVKPVLSGDPGEFNEEFQHRGIYCGLLTGGCVNHNDDVFISFSNSSPEREP